MFENEYSDAKDQTSFNIVQTSNGYYAIINENKENYSTYRCEIEKNHLTIYTNENMVLNKNGVYYDTYNFDEISYREQYHKYDSESDSYIIADKP